MQNETQTPELIDLLLWMAVAVVKRWKKIALAVVLASAVSSIVVVFVMDEEFESFGQITIPKSSTASGMQSLLSDMGGVSELLGMDLSKGSERDVILALGMSNDLHRLLIQEFHYDSIYEFTKPGKKFFYADLLKSFRKNFQIAEDDNYKLINISMKDESPERAQKVVQRALLIIDSMFVSLQTKQASRLRLYYEERYNDNKKQLDSSQTALVLFKTKNRIFDPEVQLEESVKNLGSLELEKEALEMELARIRELRGVGSSAERLLLQKIRAMETSLARLQSTGSKSGVMMSMNKSAKLQLEYAKLYQEIKTLTALDQLLRTMLEQSILQEKKQIQSFDVVDSPWANNKRVAPPRRAIVTSVFLLTLILGILASLFMEMYFTDLENNGIRSQRIRVILSYLPWFGSR